MRIGEINQNNCSFHFVDKARVLVCVWIHHNSKGNCL